MAGLPPDALKTCKDPGIDVVEQACHRSEQHGIEHIFVVARAGVRLLLSDDAEDEFAVGEVDADGVLRKWDLYGELVFALRNFPVNECDRLISTVGADHSYSATEGAPGFFRVRRSK